MLWNLLKSFQFDEKVYILCIQSLFLQRFIFSTISFVILSSISTSFRSVDPTRFHMSWAGHPFGSATFLKIQFLKNTFLVKTHIWTFKMKYLKYIEQLKLTFIFKSVISISCPCDRNLEATTDFPNLSKQFCSQDKKCFDGDPKAFSNVRIAWIISVNSATSKEQAWSLPNFC